MTKSAIESKPLPDVWIVLEYEPYGCPRVIGVFASRDGAEREASSVGPRRGADSWSSGGGLPTIREIARETLEP